MSVNQQQAPPEVDSGPGPGNRSRRLAARQRSRRHASRYLTPKEPIGKGLFAGLGVLGLLVAMGTWALLAYGGLVDGFFLPSPSTVGSALYNLFTEGNFLSDIWASARRVLLAFALAATLSVPLGIAMGSLKVVQAFFEPLVGGIRYMPASAFIPLFIIWFGIGEIEKLVVIFFGVVFALTLMVADVAANVPRDLLNNAYTLGGSRLQVFLRVLLPASMPGIVDAMRLAMGWAWTYLIVAELVAADSGIGHVILTSSRFVETDKIIAGILVIGALGIATDALFRAAYNRLFPYAERVER